MDKIKQVWHFIRTTEDVWTIIQVLLQLGLGGGMVWLFTGLKQLPQPIKALAFVLLVVAMVVAGISIIRLILAFRHKQKLALLHEGRNVAPRYIDDIKKAKEVWVAWHTATNVSSSGELTRDRLGHKITRMLLLSPNGSYLPIHARLMDNIGKSDTKSDINRAGKRLPDEGVKEIRYVDGLMLSMVICDPNDDKKGLIRIEPWSPFLEAGNRPIFYLNAKQHPISFKNLRASYNKTWNEVSASQLSSDKKDSQP